MAPGSIARLLRKGLAAWLAAAAILATTAPGVWAAGPAGATNAEFPRKLDSYGDAELSGVPQILLHRIAEEPFNLVASLIFLAAIVHTFLATKFTSISHRRLAAHRSRIERGQAAQDSIDPVAELFHFLGEVEVVFGLWAVVLMGAITAFYDWNTAVQYVSHDVNFTEAAFVVVIMTLAATRPILKLVESMMLAIARLLGGSLAALWLTILTVGPILGSFITEPAAMTIAALLLSRKFYELGPSRSFKYATLGLLFVNVSVGGTLTHFAAPPVLMVAGPWGWGTGHMLTHFGWKAIVGIVIANALYALVFRKEFARLQHTFALGNLKDEIKRRFVTRPRIEKEFERIVVEVEAEHGHLKALDERTEVMLVEVRRRLEQETLPALKTQGVDPDLIREALDKRFEEVRLAKMRRYLPGLLPEDKRPKFHDPDRDAREDPVPWWVTLTHVMFMVWTILNAHHPPLFILGMLFFLGFAQITTAYQNAIDLKPPMLVGFFLAGLVIHGGVQGWWIAPVLSQLGEVPLMFGTTVLTAFNDNAAITYLSTLVPGFTDSLKYAVVAGAVTGGGLTIIANAPNPAGQSLLKHHFDGVVSPAGLLKAALLPTVVLWLCFLLL
ncbi:MAG: hypothetical protein GXP27_20130 [Planctomycetes bacterium]|nr:hypothetical protein [Planctomycetota bacterium]